MFNTINAIIARNTYSGIFTKTALVEPSPAPVAETLMEINHPQVARAPQIRPPTRHYTECVLVTRRRRMQRRANRH
ncbi:MAG: hypothetical protein AAFZ91_10870 [Pseudomonadota bacterium]